MGTHGGGRGNGDLWGPRGDPVRTPQGPMGTPCGPMETPWGPLRGAMGTHGDTTRTHGGVPDCLLSDRTHPNYTNKQASTCAARGAQRALPEVGAKGTAPSVTQRCWQSLADAAWNYPHTSNSPSRQGAISQTAVRPHVQVDQPARCSHVN